LAASLELEFASRQFTAIEINSTFYGSQKPATFVKWRDQTPDGFMFAVKAPRFATHHRVLADAGESVRRFVTSGIAELGHKLGPVVWQFAASKAFDPGDFEAFVKLLPVEVDGLALRHALDVRHPTFMTPAYLALARRHRCATVFTDSDEYPSFADLSGDFVYARLMRSDAKHEAGLAPEGLSCWATRAVQWCRGGEPDDLPRVEAKPPTSSAARDVFMFFVGGAKEKAPAAAMALIERLR
jgi:uncharacterized protein YecE (DUF72 family)